MSSDGWHPRWSCGDAMIDAMHARILEQSAVLAIAADGDDDRRFGQSLLRLNDLVREHFVAEERLIVAAGGTHHARVHAEDHAHLLKILGDAELKIGPQGNGVAPIGRRALAGVLRRWLIKEISENDPHFLALGRREAS